ncbi:MAG: hypothetical protein AABW51_05270 [Nanoarchaeota archaeon]
MEELYKSFYVHVGKREDGTYGIMRTGRFIFVYHSKTEAEKDTNNKEVVILDIGPFVDEKRLILQDGKKGLVSCLEISKS